MWLEHPKYVFARDQLVEYLRSSKYRFRRLAPVVFLCGGAASPNRDVLRDYLRRHLSNLWLFYAESVWDQIASQGNRSALEMESELAALADLVIVIVESPGTYTELGAFSLNDALRKKLLPIVDEQHRHDHSFISSGPLRWIDGDSVFAPTIYVPFPRVLERIDQIEERIARIPESRTVKIANLAESPKYLLFFLCDLVAVIHPATSEMVTYYLQQISPSVVGSAIDVPTLVGLAVAMNLLRADKITVSGVPQVFYSPLEVDAVERPFHHSRLLNLESLRAAHVSTLLALPEARATLQQVRTVS